MKKLLLTTLLLATQLNANFFQEKDKQKHIAVSVPFGAVGGLVCREFDLQGWRAIACGTVLGMIPGVVKEGLDQHNYSGWDNRDLGADAIGAFIGAFGTVTIIEFNSGSW